ncbi:MAG: hypothetical protein B7Z37_25125 [Verrucomicrobia bacterium 12-59-8]|nr:MAG: hypothetical protein B7Z37_25125 [Verrucomicrobia bacterium 12-59-8]
MRLLIPFIFVMLGLLPAVCLADPAVDYLKRVMDQYHEKYDVYSDDGAVGNHFVHWVRMSSYDSVIQEKTGTFPPDQITGHVPAITNQWRTGRDDKSGLTPDGSQSCMVLQFRPEELPNSVFTWGGWYFQNGLHKGGLSLPLSNWGRQPGAGIDLTGATKLSFWVRGETGRERVEFFVFGVGWDADAKQWHGIDQPAIEDRATGRRFEHPDSSPKVGTGYITLSKQWKRYTIDLRGHNRSYVLGGFGWAAGSTENGWAFDHKGNGEPKPVTFYLDSISYNKSRLDEPRFLVSYEALPNSFKARRVLSGAAHMYDNALALMAFLAAGEEKHAGLIADAFVAAQQFDRTYRGSHKLAGAVRNVYVGGDLFQSPGWGAHQQEVRLHGWLGKDSKGADTWLEDKYNVSFAAGNVAWCMLSLLAYHDMVAGKSCQTYLDASVRMGEWVVRNCSDPKGEPGYIFGYQGNDLAHAVVLNKATEHNIDLYAAFRRLYLCTGDAVWARRAESAKQFVLSMWDAKDGKFWTGTSPNGRADKSKLPVDIQAWSVLSLRNELGNRNPLIYASQEGHFKVRGGFDFNNDRDGIWYEGTAQMAAAFCHQGGEANRKEWKRIVKLLDNAQAQAGKSGALPAALPVPTLNEKEPEKRDYITTGFDLMGTHDPWLYYNHAHVGATAWMILAKKGINPFWMGSGR